MTNLLALFIAMAILSAIPSVSVLLVVAHASVAGFKQGLLTTLGIVVGDLCLISVAVYGLSAIALTLGSEFTWVRYLGGIYLIGLGASLWKKKAPLPKLGKDINTQGLASFCSGLFLTLADQKAILFYVGFLPAYINLTQVSPLDTLLLMATAALAVGSVKLIYAYLGNKAQQLCQNSQFTQVLQRIAGSLMIATGVVLFFKA
ncbi:LysE family translocator [Lyngbya confervoides]|uniref:LysE family translocator n=1 Tax=Lyngbya confervoides BDU141951 TaxID=1574623 RepID=A0ABD4T895_9CYAN|nr:LysE family translocator [Lyngbya confervoides]MCM1984537.1 LysE family translocator [Lyngbya confervoides BDU141951]